MFDYEKVKPGDVLLFRPKNDSDFLGKAIAWLSYGGKYSHSAVYVGNGEMIESHLSTGVNKLKVDPAYFKNMDIFRIPRRGPYHDRYLLQYIEWLYTKIGYHYDLGAFPETFLRSVVARIFGWKNFSKDRPITNDPHSYYCSELVSYGIYLKFDGLNIVPGIHPMNQTPSDLGSSRSILKRIS